MHICELVCKTNHINKITTSEQQHTTCFTLSASYKLCFVVCKMFRFLWSCSRFGFFPTFFSTEFCSALDFILFHFIYVCFYLNSNLTFPVMIQYIKCVCMRMRACVSAYAFVVYELHLMQSNNMHNEISKYIYTFYTILVWIYLNIEFIAKPIYMHTHPIWYAHNNSREYGVRIQCAYELFNFRFWSIFVHHQLHFELCIRLQIFVFD